eukprot:TRINITY_DN1148_c0_g1_i1.p1 TRINITY_DN1148_c0_g1~~TRINITY_DN1148_c0_g1_i1.p1  ORF type:complete len:303 (-),score=63.58 TRINITY_DN1148_c0_g1_i1:69-977(-)
MSLVSRNLVLNSKLFCSQSSSFISGSNLQIRSFSSQNQTELFRALRQEVASLVRAKGCGPILVRLSWHDAGTFCKNTSSGGPRGCMFFRGKEGEFSHAANAGLHIAQDLLQPIKQKYPTISHSDFWAFAAGVAIEEMGGPKIPFRPGRVDAKEVTESAPEGRLPDGDKGADHLREIFYRQGFNDQEIVALSGAHTVGRCHPDRSGFEGPWTREPLKFDNTYYVDLLHKKWTLSKSSTGLPQYTDGEGHMMLIADMALVEDPTFKVYTEKYAHSQNLFFEDFKKVFQKLQENGTKNLGAPLQL